MSRSGSISKGGDEGAGWSRLVGAPFTAAACPVAKGPEVTATTNASTVGLFQSIIRLPALRFLVSRRKVHLPIRQPSTHCLNTRSTCSPIELTLASLCDVTALERCRMAMRDDGFDRLAGAARSVRDRSDDNHSAAWIPLCRSVPGGIAIVLGRVVSDPHHDVQR